MKILRKHFYGKDIIVFGRFCMFEDQLFSEQQFKDLSIMSDKKKKPVIELFSDYEDFNLTDLTVEDKETLARSNYPILMKKLSTDENWLIRHRVACVSDDIELLKILETDENLDVSSAAKQNLIMLHFVNIQRNQGA